MVLAEPPGEGDGPAEGGRPGPLGLPGLHRANPNTHLCALAPFHPVQGMLYASSRNDKSHRGPAVQIEAGLLQGCSWQIL